MASPDNQVPDFNNLSPAEIDRLVERGRRMRAQQAGTLYRALKGYIGGKLRSRAEQRDAARHEPFGATASRAAP